MRNALVPQAAYSSSGSPEVSAGCGEQPSLVRCHWKKRGQNTASYWIQINYKHAMFPSILGLKISIPVTLTTWLDIRIICIKSQRNNGGKTLAYYDQTYQQAHT